MKEEKYEITLLKGNVPNKHNVTFTSEALVNAVENYNKIHKDSRLFINAEGNLAMTTCSYSKLLENKEVGE